MNIIFVGKHHGRSRVFRLSGRSFYLLILAFLGLALGFAWGGYQLSSSINAIDEESSVISPATISAWRASIQEQRQMLKTMDERSKERLDALTLRMGNMQARLLRLDALGQRLTDVAKLKNGEFDFSSEPAVGGPIEANSGDSYSEPELEESLSRIEKQLDDREQQLELIEAMFASRTLQKELFIAGRPITWGWMSSPYGYRSDPFNGRRAWHAGVDFAGKEGSDIIAVASGVVTFSGDRYGYGNLVEINHGGGYTTRYAHCKELLVDVGTVIEKGQVVAKMGSTGRSTGPHVHYEVLKNGRTLDPKKFIHRASR